MAETDVPLFNTLRDWPSARSTFINNLVSEGSANCQFALFTPKTD